MNKIKIPIEFELFGNTVKVIFVKDLSDLDGHSGIFKPPSTIELQEANSVHPIDDVENTYFHELLHSIFHMLGRFELNKDEKFIHSVAGLLHQSFKTARYK